VAGIEWRKSGGACARLVDRVCGSDSHLLLAHNPKAFFQAARRSVALSLSGHTHGGQVAMRGRPGANLAATARYTAGLYERGASRLYVTSGVGAWFPLRVNCPAEIAMITMRHIEPEPEAPDDPPVRKRKWRRPR
jgi:predicted MPP superfamily phosphohydrolase